MNIFFRSSLNSLSRSLYLYYFTFISDDAEKKKNTEAKKDRQYISSSVKEKIEKNIFIFNNKITTSSMSNNFRKLEKKVQKVQRIAYHHQRLKHLTVLNQLQKRRQNVYII